MISNSQQPKPAAAPESEWIRDAVGMLWAQKWVMGLTALAILLGSVVIVWRWPAMYRATASILMQGRGSHGVLSGGGSARDTMSKEDLSSELEILRSPDLFKLTVRAMHPPKPASVTETPVPEAAPGVTPRRVSMPADMQVLLRELEASRPAPSSATSPPPPYDDLAEAFLRSLQEPLPSELETEFEALADHLEVQILPATKVIRCTLTGRDPRLIEQALNSYLDQYLLYRVHLFNPADQERFLSERAQQYKQRVEALENQLLEQARQTAVVHPEREIESNLELKRELVRQFDTLTDERIQSNLISDPALDARIAQIQARIRDIDEVNLRLQQEMVERARIARETALGEFSYQLFSERQEEGRLQRAIAAANLSGDVTILSRADLTAELVFPRPKLVLAVGAVAALLAAFGVGCLNEFLNDTFRTERDLARHTGLPVIATFRGTRTKLQ